MNYTKKDEQKENIPAVPQEPSKDTQLVIKINKLIPKWQALNIILNETGETLQDVIQNILPLMNEKNQEIVRLKAELETLKPKTEPEKKEKK